MPRLSSEDPDRTFQRLRASGRARLPVDPIRASVDRRELLRRGTTGSLDGDVRDFEQMRRSEGRDLLNSRGYRGMDMKNLAGAGPEALEKINEMHRQRTGQMHGGGMGNAQVAWPKLRDPFEQFREKAWWFLKEGDFSSSLKKIREWMRLVYMTHPLVPSLIDIYSRFPLLDIEFKHKDQKLCTPAEAPIWMGDYSFKPISEVVVGDEVIGWDRSSGKAKLKRVKVTETYRYDSQPIIKATMESGRTIRSTADHKWANYLYSPGRKPPKANESFQYLEGRRLHAVPYFEKGTPQKEIAEILGVSKGAVSLWHKAWKVGGIAALKSRFVVNRAGTEQRYAEWTTLFPGASLKHVVDPTPELQSEKERLAAAWLGGVYDGEGSGKWIGQSKAHNPDVYAKIVESLEFLGFRVYESKQEHNIGFHQDRGSYTIHQSRQDFVNFLNWTDPVRRIRTQADKVALGGNYGEQDRVASVEPDGVEPVYALETETGNYVAWGYASSNSDFYNDLFLNQLDYQEFLFEMSREYWTVGEAFALGSWHEGIGCWDADELLNPDDVSVSRNSVLRQYQFHLKVPEGIKKLIETRQPREEYEMLVRFYPYILQWAQQNSEIPVSDVLLKQLKFKVNPWEPHGVPIMMRGFKTMMLEMSLEAAQDAVADRLYSPLILANLGIEDVGDGEGPWIPEPEEIDALRDDLALALMSDFRLMVYHHGLTIQSVFGREAMPRFDMDFERVDMKLMQIFGIGPELLQGGNSSAPYASGALNRELLTQMLSTYQVAVKRFLRERMEVVAERQGHFEFEKRGEQRFPVFETVLMQSELTGEEYVEERPKLAVPEVNFRVMNLRDETVERQFLLELKQAGIPVADASFMVNVPIEFDDEVTRIQKEKMDKVLAELHYQKRLFTAIFVNHLPVPPEYAQAYMEFVSGIQGMALMMAGTDVTNNPPAPNLFPNLEPSEGDLANAMMATGQGEEGGEGGESRSAESDSMRGSTPRKSKLVSLGVSEYVEEGGKKRQVQKTATWVVPEEFSMYSDEQARQEYIDIGEAAWIEKYLGEVGSNGGKGSLESDDKPSQDVEVPVASGYEWTQQEAPSEPLEPGDSVRVAGTKTMATPSFMEARRKMVLPKGTNVRGASQEELDDATRRWSDAEHDDDDGGLEGPGEVPGEDDQPSE